MDLAAKCAQALQDGVNILTGATRHRVPLRSVKNLQEAVVITKAGEANRWKPQNGFDWAGPDRTGHGEQVIIAKGLTVLAFAQKTIKRQRTGCFGGRARECGRLAIKAHHVK